MAAGDWSVAELAEFMEQFRPEAMEHVRALDEQLLKLERTPADPAPIREMFLSAHTIKGAAGMLDLRDIRELTHALEDVLGYLRDTRQPCDREMADLMFQSIDLLRDLISRAQPGSPEDDPAPIRLADSVRKYAQARFFGAAPDPGPAAPPRILLVDDSATVRMLEMMLLTEAGFQVDAVGDGQQALAMAEQTPYDLVVTGIESRGLRGLDLAAALRSTPETETVPIILMSTDDNARNRQVAAELGVDAYIRKGSFGRHRLVEAARELLAARKKG